MACSPAGFLITKSLLLFLWLIFWRGNRRVCPVKIVFCLTILAFYLTFSLTWFSHHNKNQNILHSSASSHLWWFYSQPEPLVDHNQPNKQNNWSSQSFWWSSTRFEYQTQDFLWKFYNHKRYLERRSYF